jgi:hypothetical protein
MAKLVDRLANALAYASQLSATYEKSGSVKPIWTGAKVCPICHHEVKRLVSDHCHTTGERRENICGLCNSGLGFFRDDVAALRRAIRYLVKHKQQHEVLTALDIRKHTRPSDDAA